MEPYNFKNAIFDVSSIIPLIRLHGENLVGAEVGVFKGQSLLTVLHNCPNVTKMYGVDAFKPYDDFIGSTSDMPAMVLDIKAIEFVKATCYHHLKYSGCLDRVEFLEMDSDEAAKTIEDDSLDFVFLDAYLSYEQACNDLRVWYPKVKTGGIFAGHDWNDGAIQDAVTEFRDEFGIIAAMSDYLDTWVWIKPVGEVA
jgi:hypothetical protein